MTEKETKKYLGKYSLTLVFASILLFSAGALVHNAFADKAVDTIPVGSKPWGVAVNPNTNMIYVANSDCCLTSPTISVIDGATNNVINTIPVFGRPSGVAVNPSTNMIYVAEGGMRVQVIDGSTNSIVATIFLYGPESGNIPHEITVNPVTNMIYVTYYTTEHFGTIGGGPSRVAVINGTSNTVVDTLNEINYPNGITANQVTNKIYVAIGTYGINANNAVSVIDGSNNSSMNNINVSNSPNFVAVNPDTNRIYVTEYSGNKLAVIDGTTDSFITDIPVGSVPYGVGVNVNTNKIFVANNANNTVSVIDGLSNQVLDTIQVGQSPYEIAVNPNTNKIYVTNFNSNTVSVISDIVITPPSAPTNLTATGKITNIDLTWASPSDNGGMPILGYVIQRSTDNGVTWSTIVSDTNSTGTTYTDSHLIPVKVYTYRVSAMNSVGTSDSSNTVSTKPLSIPHLVSVSNKDETHFK